MESNSASECSAIVSESGSSLSLEIGDVPNQPLKYNFPKRKFGSTKPVFRSFQKTWFEKWPWIHYDEQEDKAFCFYCVKALKQGSLPFAGKAEDTFVIRGYTNWKDASGVKHGGFHNHEQSHIHKASSDIMLSKHKDVGELLSTTLAKERAIKRGYLRKILQNVVFLARQGLAFRGNWISSEGDTGSGGEIDSNFHQLLLLRSKDDPAVLEFMNSKSQKYTDHHIQNELLKILALGHLRRIADQIRESGYFTLEADEVTDASNKEQVIVCLRYVDSMLEVHEDFIGSHHVDDITSQTIIHILKDTVLRMNLQMSMCRGQCYDGASNMKRVAQEIKVIEPRALYLHCYGHSLNLAISDTLKSVKSMSHALDYVQEICKLLKYSPRRGAIFQKMKAEISPEVPGIRNLCPTRWTMRAASLESIRVNYEALEATWSEAIDIVHQSELKARINGVSAKMKEFDFFFCLVLAERILKHTDNFSKSMQKTSMTASDGHNLSDLCVKVLKGMRNDMSFDLLWALVEQWQQKLNVSDPLLPRAHKRPRRYEDGSEEHFHPSSPKEYYKHIYFQCLDCAIMAIQDRFEQIDYSICATLEKLLLLAAQRKDYTSVLEEVVSFYGSDFNRSELNTQLEVFGHMEIECSGRALSFRDIHSHVKSLSPAQLCLISQVVVLVRFILLMPATNAVSERSASAMRRIKSYLRTSMTQSRLNNIMVLHIHKHLTDSIDEVCVLNEFISANDDRKRVFGKF